MGVLVRCGPGYQDLLVPPCGERKVDFGLLSLRPGPAERSWMGATPLAPHMLSLWQTGRLAPWQSFGAARVPREGKPMASWRASGLQVHGPIG
jgi:hypothetical protein